MEALAQVLGEIVSSLKYIVPIVGIFAIIGFGYVAIRFVGWVISFL